MTECQKGEGVTQQGKVLVPEGRGDVAQPGPATFFDNFAWGY